MTFDISNLRIALESMGFHLYDDEYDKFFTYCMMLLEKNKVMNLTAITDIDEVILKHFVDSVMLHKALDPKEITTMIDVGTGAGFPGIPLKIVYENLNVILLDSLQKRLEFLDDVIDELRLTGIETVHARAEDAGQAEVLRERFDLCVSRAVANLSTLSELCLPFVKEGGHFVAYKAGKVEDEVDAARHAIELLGGGNIEVINFTLPKSDLERSLIRIEKINKTPSKYPRKAGRPSKEPLE
ncbi:MAG: 16S rRNA (guanine(527)-N(7))-methyltransferase RsmG [Lachnospiraceae bacterium]|nr:16S rRNA (guanine(527)-N(7))-methyltransferase RsmG [Lachnospiraceae bacterium]